MKKKRFARWIALVLCLASALSLAACGDDDQRHAQLELARLRG